MSDGFASGQSAIVGDATYGIGKAPGLESGRPGQRHPDLVQAATMDQCKSLALGQLHQVGRLEHAHALRGDAVLVAAGKVGEFAWVVGV